MVCLGCLDPTMIDATVIAGFYRNPPEDVIDGIPRVRWRDRAINFEIESYGADHSFKIDTFLEIDLKNPMHRIRATLFQDNTTYSVMPVAPEHDRYDVSYIENECQLRYFLNDEYELGSMMVEQYLGDEYYRFVCMGNWNRCIYEGSRGEINGDDYFFKAEQQTMQDFLYMSSDEEDLWEEDYEDL